MKAAQYSTTIIAELFLKSVNYFIKKSTNKDFELK